MWPKRGVELTEAGALCRLWEGGGVVVVVVVGGQDGGDVRSQSSCQHLHPVG